MFTRDPSSESTVKPRKPKSTKFDFTGIDTDLLDKTYTTVFDSRHGSDRNRNTAKTGPALSDTEKICRLARVTHFDNVSISNLGKNYFQRTKLFTGNISGTSMAISMMDESFRGSVASKFDSTAANERLTSIYEKHKALNTGAQTVRTAWHKHQKAAAESTSCYKTDLDPTVVSDFYSEMASLVTPRDRRSDFKTSDGNTASRQFSSLARFMHDSEIQSRNAILGATAEPEASYTGALPNDQTAWTVMQGLPVSDISKMDLTGSFATGDVHKFLKDNNQMLKKVNAARKSRERYIEGIERGGSAASRSGWTNTCIASAVGATVLAAGSYFAYKSYFGNTDIAS